MDALSEVLRAVRLTGAVFFNGEFTAPWGFEAASVDKLATLLPAGTDRLLIYHLVIEGRAELRTGAAGASLTAGDLVILPHGDTHTFSDGAPREYLNGTDTLLETFGTTDLNLIRYGGGGAPTRFICGYFGCERDAEQLFLGGLPPVIKVHLRGDPAGQWLERSICDLLRDGNSGKSKDQTGKTTRGDKSDKTGKNTGNGSDTRTGKDSGNDTGNSNDSRDDS